MGLFDYEVTSKTLANSFRDTLVQAFTNLVRERQNLSGTVRVVTESHKSF